MTMSSSGMGALPQAHKPTLGYTVAIIIGVFIVYHFTLGKK